MVWIAQARAQPRSCALQPAPARPARAYWEAAQAEHLARPKLPAFSLPPPTPPPQPRGQEGWVAALPLPPSDAGSDWEQQAALLPLAGLRGPADQLCREPQAVQLPPAAPEPALPPFLLPRLRTPCIDEWQRRSTALADEPCLRIPTATSTDAAGQVWVGSPIEAAHNWPCVRHQAPHNRLHQTAMAPLCGCRVTWLRSSRTSAACGRRRYRSCRKWTERCVVGAAHRQQ